MDRQEEVSAKLERLRAMMSDRGLSGLLLRDRGNFAWLTAGGLSYVNAGSETGVGALLVTADRFCLVANNIEARRFAEEELVGLDLDVVDYPWHEAWAEREAVAKIIDPASVGRDGPAGAEGAGHDVAAAVTVARGRLLEPEVERYKVLGALTARTTEAVCRRIERGMSEDDVVAMLHHDLAKEGVRAPVCLVAADERIALRRHPISKGRPIDRRVMVVVCAEARGLIVALTRIVTFEPVDAELGAKHRAVCEIEAAACAATKPGRTLGEVFHEIVGAYERRGYGEEWRLHHQGGPCGYAGRDAFAVPGSRAAVQGEQAFAWNPSITGTKSEDTVLVRDDGSVEPISEPGPGWPTVSVEAGGLSMARADVLTRA